ncbi:ABC transporter substrate-binding protein [Nocardioides campestrisoli]|uniref:ABC transporter substrate-binding protein n=1 Tax=Nocardioides campestrisoli TaxID=2736757 RepID=UPI0015E79138|nr:ABC transporter substrate-binding protein [Nocardioides campestrisoli]
MFRFVNRVNARRAGAALAVTSLLALTAACGDDSDASANGLQKVKVYLAVPTMNTALINLAFAENLDEKHGLDMEIVKSGAGSTNQVAALRSGQFDFAGSGTATVADANAEGAGLVIVGGTGGLINNLVLGSDVAAGLDVTADDPIEERIQALKGLTIATSGPGSSSNLSLRLILEKYGLTPDEDVTIAPVNDQSAIVAGIRRGQYDGSFYGVGVADVNVADGSGELWVSLPRGDVEEFDDVVGVVLISSDKFVEENPETVEAFHATLADAQKMVAEDPEAAGESLRKSAFPDLDEKVFEMSWEQSLGGYPEGALFTETNWNAFVDLYQPVSEKDYSQLSFADTVAEPTRGE